MESYKKLLLGNRAWAQEKLSQQPDYFSRYEKVQAPDFLWIGCADSRVPAATVVGAEAGEIFVHRNIANIVIHTDFNVLSVLQYAVEVLKVKHVIVCGHYGCGGVRTAMSNQDLGLINKWLRHIKDVYRFYRAELEKIEDFEQRFDRLVELNVMEQVHNLAESSIVQKAWAQRGGPTLHGWVYDVGTGLLKDITKLDATSRIEDIYMYDFTQSKS